MSAKTTVVISIDDDIEAPKLIKNWGGATAARRATPYAGRRRSGVTSTPRRDKRGSESGRSPGEKGDEVQALKELFAGLARRGPGPVAATLLIWLALEILAFWAVVEALGALGAVAVGLLTTLAGIGLFRHVGRQAVEGLKASAAGESPREGAFLDGTLAAVGAALLVLPGFASDFVGLALAAPSLRGWIARRFSPRFERRAPPGVIDLDPSEWSTVVEPDETRREALTDAGLAQGAPRREAQGRAEPGAR
jgi:UPF0716 protein FxsA